jgi:hypothetical protein
MIPRNIALFPNYKALQPRREHSSLLTLLDTKSYKTACRGESPVVRRLPSSLTCSNDEVSCRFIQSTLPEETTSQHASAKVINIAVKTLHILSHIRLRDYDLFIYVQSPYRRLKYNPNWYNRFSENLHFTFWPLERLLSLFWRYYLCSLHIFLKFNSKCIEEIDNFVFGGTCERLLVLDVE